MVNRAFVYKGFPPPRILLICYAVATGLLVAWRHQFWALVFVWPTFLYALITYAYIFDGTFGARLFNKDPRTTGHIPLWRLLVFSPYLVLSWVVWWLKHVLFLSHEDPYTLVAPGLYL